MSKVADDLRRLVEESVENECEPCIFGIEELIGVRAYTSQLERMLLLKIADRIEAELLEAATCTDMPLSECVAHYTGLPAHDGEAIEDYLNRYYIPRPRFEDGEPACTPCQVERDGRDITLYGYNIRENGMYELHLGSHTVHMRQEETLKRPTPKVYDADGVEIKVGDTIYYQDTGNEYTVVKLDPKDEYHALLNSSIDGKEQWHCIARFTHERPVFDAEGVRICEGDTVWDTKGYRGTVIEIKPDVPQVVVEISLNNHAFLTPDVLTHREPDSLEKLRDEISEAVESWGVDEFDWQLARTWSDRLTALIERGK